MVLSRTFLAGEKISVVGLLPNTLKKLTGDKFGLPSLLPCAALLEGEYGIKGPYVGVPVKLGSRGIEQIYELKLTADEKKELDRSAAAVQELVDILKPRLG